MDKNKFLDDSQIIKKDNNKEIDNQEAENIENNEIYDWPVMTDDVKQSLNIQDEEEKKIDKEEKQVEKKEKKKKIQQKKNKKEIDDILKTKQDILTEMHDKTMLQLIEREISIHVSQRMLKKNGNNETRKRYMQTIENSKQNILELREKLDILKEMLETEINGK